MLTAEGEAIIKQLEKVIIEGLKESLKRKGRNDTGALSDSIEIVRKDTNSAVVLEGYFLKYGLYQEGGKKAGTFPNVGAIEKWVRRKLGISDGSLSVAWAIAKTHARVGMHTRNGQLAPEERGWMSEGLKAVNAEIETSIENAFFQDMDIFITNLVDEFNKRNN